MAQPRTIDLSLQQRQELAWVRDHHEKASMRQRAAAILKVAGGCSMLQVARHGLLKPRRYETVSEWITRSLAEGVSGLLIQAGRGRKPAFSPCEPGGGASRLATGRDSASLPRPLWP